LRAQCCFTYSTDFSTDKIGVCQLTRANVSWRAFCPQGGFALRSNL
jgi:hypothetical protein